VEIARTIRAAMILVADDQGSVHAICGAILHRPGVQKDDRGPPDEEL
jgi:hypothetical protein